MTVRYVDPDATGLGDGTSWTDAYTSLSAWEAAEQADLVTATDAHTVYVRSSGGTSDTSVVNISGWTTDATYNITIDQTTNDNHGGVWNSSAYRLVVSNGTAVVLMQEEDINVFGLQLEQTYASGGSRGFFYSTGMTRLTTEVSGCLIRRTSSADTADSHAGINCEHSGTASDTIVFRNNIIYDTYCGIFYKSRTNDTCSIDNNTVADVTGSGYYYDLSGANDTFNLRNNIAFNCGTPYTKSSGATTETITYNAYDSGTDPGSNGVSLSATGSDNFSNYASNDFHLVSGSNAYSAGTDLSGTFTDDIDGDTRSLWSIGADDGTAAASGSSNLTLLGVG